MSRRVLKPVDSTLERIANAVERIASSLEAAAEARGERACPPHAWCEPRTDGAVGCWRCGRIAASAAAALEADRLPAD